MSMHSALQTFRGHRVPRFRIIEHRNRWFAISGVLLVLSLGGLFVRGLTLSIDFEGGALVKYTNDSGVTVAQIDQVLSKYDRGDAEVQIVNGNEVSIRTSTLTTLHGDQAAMISELAKQAGVNVNDVNITDVGPTWGAQISSKAVKGLVIFLVLVTAYIAFRFEWKMAMSAQAALLHDIIITTGIYALVGREVTPGTVIALLTILGYSLYDTVVIFDKVQENTESTALVARDTYAGVVNMSLNQTLMRSVNTSLVVLLPILSLLLFGGQTLKDFAFALFIGVAMGAYSSVFVASPLLVVFKEREPKYRNIKERAQATPRKKRDIGISEEEVARELEAAGIVKRTTQKAAGSSTPSTSSPSKGSGGSKNKKTTAKQRRRR
jgi:preprotein translocase subunit SecF